MPVQIQQRAQNNNLSIQAPSVNAPKVSITRPGTSGGQSLTPDSYVRPVPPSYRGSMVSDNIRPDSLVSVRSSASQIAQPESLDGMQFAPYPVKRQPELIGEGPTSEATASTIPRPDRFGDSPFATPRSMSTLRSTAPTEGSYEGSNFTLSGSGGESTVVSNIAERRIIPSNVSSLERGSEAGNYRYAVQQAEAIPNRINAPAREVALNRQIAERQIRGGADRVETEQSLGLRPPPQTGTTRFVRGIQQRIEGGGNVFSDARGTNAVRFAARNRFPNFDPEGGQDVFSRYSASASENSLSSLGTFTEHSMSSVTPFSSDTLPPSMGGGLWSPSEVSMSTESSLSSAAAESGMAAAEGAEMSSLAEVALL